MLWSKFVKKAILALGSLSKVWKDSSKEARDAVASQWWAVKITIRRLAGIKSELGPCRITPEWYDSPLSQCGKLGDNDNFPRILSSVVLEHPTCPAPSPVPSPVPSPSTLTWAPPLPSPTCPATSPAASGAVATPSAPLAVTTPLPRPALLPAVTSMHSISEVSHKHRRRTLPSNTPSESLAPASTAPVLAAICLALFLIAVCRRHRALGELYQKIVARALVTLLLLAAQRTLEPRDDTILPAGTRPNLTVEMAGRAPVDLAALVGLPIAAAPMPPVNAQGEADTEDLDAAPAANQPPANQVAAAPGAAPVVEPATGIAQDGAEGVAADDGADSAQQVAVGAGVEVDGEGNGEGGAAAAGEEAQQEVGAELKPAGGAVGEEEEKEAGKDGVEVVGVLAGQLEPEAVFDGEMPAREGKGQSEQPPTSPRRRDVSLGGFGLAGMSTLASNIFAPGSGESDDAHGTPPVYTLGAAPETLAGRRSPTTPCPPQLAVRAERMNPARRPARPVDLPYAHHEPSLVTPPRAQRVGLVSDLQSSPSSPPRSPSSDRRRMLPPASSAVPSPRLLAPLPTPAAPASSPPMTMAEFGDVPAPPNGPTPRASRHSLWVRKMVLSSPAAPGPTTPRVAGVLGAAVERGMQVAERREVEEAPGLTAQPTLRTAYDLTTPRTRAAIDADAQRYAGGRPSDAELNILCALPRLVQPFARSNGVGAGAGAGGQWLTELSGLPETEEEEENIPVVAGEGKGKARMRGEARGASFI
ncbi:hypothetical protein C8R46DRAFT_1031191 [Mycena filopes]|nr:hypothetical protein C8R46DRAFT_1031191 [Mycena filopes]